MRYPYYRNNEREKIADAWAAGHAFALRKELDRNPSHFLQDLLLWFDSSRSKYAPAVLVSQSSPFKSYGGDWESCSGFVLSSNTVVGGFKRHADTSKITGAHPNRFQKRKKEGGYYYTDFSRLHSKHVETFWRFFNPDKNHSTKIILAQFLKNSRYIPHHDQQLKQYLQDEHYLAQTYQQIVDKYGSPSSMNDFQKNYYKRKTTQCQHQRKPYPWHTINEPVSNEVITKPVIFKEKSCTPFEDILGVYCNPKSPQQSMLIFSTLIILGFRPILFEYNDQTVYDKKTPRTLTVVEKPSGWTINIDVNDAELLITAKKIAEQLLLYDSFFTKFDTALSKTHSLTALSLQDLLKIYENREPSIALEKKSITFFGSIIKNIRQQYTSFTAFSWQNAEHPFTGWLEKNTPLGKKSHLSLLELTTIEQLIDFENFDQLIPFYDHLIHEEEPCSLLGIFIYLLLAPKCTTLPDSIKNHLNQADFSEQDPLMIYLMDFLLTLFPEKYQPESLIMAMNKISCVPVSKNAEIIGIGKQCLENQPEYDQYLLNFLCKKNLFNLIQKKLSSRNTENILMNTAFLTEIVRKNQWQLTSLLMTNFSTHLLIWNTEIIIAKCLEDTFDAIEFKFFITTLMKKEIKLKKSGSTLLDCKAEISFEAYQLFLEKINHLLNQEEQKLATFWLNQCKMRDQDCSSYLDFLLEQSTKISHVELWIPLQNTIDASESVKVNNIITRYIQRHCYYAAGKINTLFLGQATLHINQLILNFEDQTAHALWRSIGFSPKPISLLNSSPVCLRIFLIYYTWCYTLQASLKRNHFTQLDTLEKIFQHAKERPNSRTKQILTFIYQFDGNEQSKELNLSVYEYSRTKSNPIFWSLTHSKNDTPHPPDLYHKGIPYYT